jgi:hypothetical protein
MSPLRLTMSQQMRVRRRFGSYAYDDTTTELKVEVAPADASVSAVITLLQELTATSA